MTKNQEDHDDTTEFGEIANDWQLWRNCVTNVLLHMEGLRFKDDMQRFFTKLMQKSFLAAYCNINLSV